jgi:violaxanthin de-epoxidase
LERSTLQNFKQDPEKPGVLYNRGNEYLHYEDTWYVVGSKPDSYVFVYYRGNNDAWRGYGGAVVYTRARSLPAELIPELRAQAAAANMDWDDFTVTDNKCGPRPPAPPSLLAEVEGEVEDSLRSFGKGFTIVERRLAEEVAAEEKVLEDELRAFERALERVERSAAAKVAEEEEAVVRGVEGLLSRLFGGGGGAK